MPVIDARGLRREFRTPFSRTRVRAGEGLDLAVERGRVFGLLGPN
jgi:ABC-type multidrug transport system ATPase subunit